MRGLKKILKVFLCLSLLIIIATIGLANIKTVCAKEKPVASVTKRTLYVNGSPYTIKVNNALAKAVITYSSSNKAIATVSKTGVITPVKAGSATVTVKIVQNGGTYSSKIALTVKKINVIGYLQYGGNEITKCYDNEDYTLVTYYTNLEKYKYSYSLSSNEIINVTDCNEEDGVFNIFFKTLKIGKVTITVTETITGVTYSKTINIVKSDTEVKYDGEVVYYGSYPQTEVTGKELTDAIISADYYGNEAVVDGVKYLRATYKDVTYRIDNSYKWDWKTEREEVPYHYFKYEPIAWRVLNDTNGTLLLLSDRVLYSENYNNASEPITWEKSSIRNELNTIFLEEAFSEIEQKSILTSTLENKDTKTVFRYDEKSMKIIKDNSNGSGGKGGKTTKDKVFLLSLDEALNPKYWIGINNNASLLQRANPLKDRMVYCTNYALFSGCIIDSKTLSSDWMLRSPAESNYFVSGVAINGLVTSYGADAWTAYIGIRPAIQIKRSELITPAELGIVNNVLDDYFN